MILHLSGGLILLTASWVWGQNFPSLAAPVAPGQLRDGRGRESPALHALQSLPAPLPGAETGSRQRCIFWETHPLHFHGTPHAAPGDEVTAFSFFPLGRRRVFFPSLIHSLLVLQRELQVPLLRYTGETRLPAQQAPGGHAVHGAPAAARPAETEVRRLRRRAPPPVPPPRAEAVPSAFRFKPVQKFDSCAGENYSGGGQAHPGAAEQTVIAQRQHHQQFLGQSAGAFLGAF